ncbi:probable ATP-dependent RNA helicase DHX37 [Eriocheir sinensis]|uniref:probable ATP-dependent RNA helicase DHX37 n=1 Tax=Eriocheir sinensis TaxID=95602 RepID=UPI0021C7AD0B|nr:probable ATP-dependent RNA helicase DHX37 [Eriocheir sinensis]
MGRSRLKYKAKPTVVTDDSELRKIKVEIDSNEKYDSSNALVLPSAKRSTKKLRDKNATPVKLLSKKKRKLLEKVIEQKEKKAKRADLLAALQEVKASPQDLAKLTQLQTTQTLGRKKFMSSDYTVINNNEVNGEDQEAGRVPSCIRRGKKRRKQQQEEEEEEGEEQERQQADPTIVRLGELSSSSDESEEEEEEEQDDKEESQKGEENEEAAGNKGPAVEKKPEEEENETSKEKKDKDPSHSGEASEKPRKAIYMSLNRPAEVQASRLKLPILAEEQAVMEAVSEHPVTVLVGTTGSGKTTQVPQFLYEAGYTSGGRMIGITEPRRVAAVSMARRVGEEMGLSAREVSYQIRFEGNATSDTCIKFMTDGVLLKEIQLDPTLKKYSVIIIDEAHERSVFSDILIGILSRIIPRREAKGNPLKLIIMSATLKVEDFTLNPRLFKEPKPPVIKVESRMFDVTIHYNKHTVEDYVGEAYKKACKIHRQLPEGGILVFLTGQQEVNSLVRKLRTTFPLSGRGGKKEEEEEEGPANVSGYRRRKEERKTQRKAEKETPTRKIILPEVKLENFISALPDDAEGEVDDGIGELEDRGAIDCGDSDLDLDLEEEGEDNEGPRGGEQPLWVLPLYSLLPPERQQLVFQPPPEGTRLCVVATNVAETSLTLPSVKYVVDSGRVKEKVYDKMTGVSMFHVTWTSQASANQRAGRAGRTAPGHCYRLYSSAVFNDEFAKFSMAEIQRRPIDDLVLVMKAMNLPVINFPFPTPPDHLQVRHAMKRLLTLGALEEMPEPAAKTVQDKKRMKGEKAKDLSRITSLGKAMAAFPLAPRYGKMLALSHQHNLLPYTVALVAALTVPEVLIETPVDVKESVDEIRKRWRGIRQVWSGSGQGQQLGDAMVLLRAVGAAEQAGSDRTWCEKNGLRHKAVVEIRKLRRQLTNEINLIIPSCDLLLDPDMPPPTEEQARLLRQVVLAGTVDHVARRVDDCDLKTAEDKVKWKHAYRTQEMEEPVFLSSSSVLYKERPKWVVYQDVYQTHKMFMRNVTAIENEWLPVFAPALCTLSPPLETPEPHYDPHRDAILCHCTATYGPAAWEIPQVEVEYPAGREIFRWVAYYFLLGQLCPVLAPFVQYLNEPKTLISPVALRFRKERESLLQALMSRGATTLAKLKEIWASEPKYLLREYTQWLQNKELKPEVARLWPPLEKAAESEWS